MFSKGTKKGTVRFIIRPACKAKECALVGSFSQWNLLPMIKQKNGTFALTIPVLGGYHEYKFILDGQWIDDPDTEFRVPNPFGGTNSFLRIEK